MAKGDFGEHLAAMLLSQWTVQGQLFDIVMIGGKWPTIDVYAEISSAGNQKMVCFFQVKSTELGYTKHTHRRLKIQVPKDKVNKLSAYSAPTYLIGVDYKRLNWPTSVAYIKTIRGSYLHGISSMETTNVVNPANLILLKNEVEAFWQAINPSAQKNIYLTNF